MRKRALAAPAFLLGVQDSLDLVAIAFPKFSDGRGFSIGRALRGQGYKGTLRASGALGAPAAV